MSQVTIKSGGLGWGAHVTVAILAMGMASCAARADPDAGVLVCIAAVAHGGNPGDGGGCFVGDDGGLIRLNRTSGSGFVDGGLAFALRSAYESFLEFGCSEDGGSTRALSISLSAQPAVCSSSGLFIDPAGPALQFLLIGAPVPGEFPVGSLLPFHSKAVLWTPDSATPRTAYNGSVTVVTLPDCGASGTFSLTFEALDGGAPIQLSGGFSADYCTGFEVYGFRTNGNP